VVVGGWKEGREVLPGFEQGTWLAGGLVAMAAAAVAGAAEEEDARDEDEGAEDGGEDGCVDV
jgi:hypothetical protein